MKLKLSASLICGGWIATTIRLGPSDRWPLLAVVAYIPSLLVLVAAILSLILIHSVHEHSRQRMWLYLNWLLIAVAFLLIAADNRQFFRAAGEPQTRFRILHWNVWGSRNGFIPLAGEIRPHNADLVCLSEPILHPAKEDYPPYEYLLGGKWYTLGEGNMLLLSRFPLRKIDAFADEAMKGVIAEDLANKVRILFLDIDPDLRYLRRDVFRLLSRLLNEKQWNPAVILGDFNTPANAFSLMKTFSRHYKDAYFAAGSGVGYTWLSWIPMARIDLMYVHQNHRVLRYKTFFSNLSDHRLQVVDIDLPPPPDVR